VPYPPTPFGDRAFRVSHRTSVEASAWAEAVRREAIPGVVDVIAAYETVAVLLDPDQGGIDDVWRRLRNVEIDDLVPHAPRSVSVPAFYDGPDLPEVASRLGLDVATVIAEHSSRVYEVKAIGFRPGFPYLEALAQPLRGLPRRDHPRTEVPAGSVAIVGKQTAIYPERSPGGWHLIARTPISLVDLQTGWFAFRVGDFVRFHPVDREEFEVLRRKGGADACDGSEY
jgi:KipI family sensor histidine kinase inhibitor